MGCLSEQRDQGWRGILILDTEYLFSLCCCQADMVNLAPYLKIIVYFYINDIQQIIKGQKAFSVGKEK